MREQCTAGVACKCLNICLSHKRVCDRQPKPSSDETPDCPMSLCLSCTMVDGTVISEMSAALASGAHKENLEVCVPGSWTINGSLIVETIWIAQ